MKSLDRLQFSAEQCQRELDSFEDLLKSNLVLGERKHITGFFRRNRQLSLLLGQYAPPGPADVVADEFDVSGDFVADMIVGNSKSQTYCMVEFEEGAQNSIFTGGNGKTRVFTSRFDRGFSQLVDWFCALDDQKKSDKFRDCFGIADVKFHGLLVIGRSSGFSGNRDLSRFRWRRNHIIVDSHAVQCITYDQLCEELKGMLPYDRPPTKVVQRSKI
jgi:hypothetical protein